MEKIGSQSLVLSVRERQDACFRGGDFGERRRVVGDDDVPEGDGREGREEGVPQSPRERVAGVRLF